MVELSKGVELRANMDLEIARAPTLINGAGIIAVVAFQQATVEWVDRFRRTIWVIRLWVRSLSIPCSRELVASDEVSDCSHFDVMRVIINSMSQNAPSDARKFVGQGCSLFLCIGFDASASL